jgi:segregation and condensation protein A
LAPIYVKSLAVGEGAPETLELSSEFDEDESAANDDASR